MNSSEEGMAHLFADAFPTKPSPALKDKIWQSIVQSSVFPLLTDNREVSWWKDATKHYMPKEFYKKWYMVPLVQTDAHELFLVWLNDTLQEEAHQEMQESFLILEGSCTFIAEGQQTHHSEGDFVIVPPVLHTVQLPPETEMKAIVQRVRMAV